MLLVEFPLYILNHAKHARKMLRTKPNHEAQFPSNPQNFSPIGIHCQNGRKGLEGQNSESSSSRCALPKKSENTCTNPKTKIRGNQTILRIKDCKQKKDDMMVKLPTKEDSNQKIQIANQIKIL
jgi:hypothetical protein